MKNKVIRLVCTTDNCAEKEYIKEFFNFIGCFFFEKKFNMRHGNDWLVFLKPGNDKYDIDILVNYFGYDPFMQESNFRGTKRIYCYFSFEEGYVMVLEKPLPSLEYLQPNKNISKKTLRQTALNDLVSLIWKDELDTKEAVLNIVDSYTDNSCVDLFYFLQLKTSFEFLSTNDVAKVYSNNVPPIKLHLYLINAIKAMYFVYANLETSSDPYSQYARINAANMIYSLYQKLDPSKREYLQEIYLPFIKPFHMVSPNDMISMLNKLLDDNPNFLSAYLLMASIYNDTLNYKKDTENCYVKLLTSIPKKQNDYAFIWSQCGDFFLRNKDIEKAIKFYNNALEINPQYYPALLKLSYNLLKVNEADNLNVAKIYLKRAIEAISCGESDEQHKDGSSPFFEKLSLEESEYFLRIYHLLSITTIIHCLEYTMQSYVFKMCMAALAFEKAGLISRISTPNEYNDFFTYHSFSEPVYSAWQVLKPWSEGVAQEEYVAKTVRARILKQQQTDSREEKY